MEVAAGDEAGLLEDRQHALTRGARVSGGLQHDQLAGLQRVGDDWEAPMSGPRSGSRLAVSGVGTAMMIASHWASREVRVVASMREATAWSRSDGMSSM